jgi:hypothetical protein
MLRDKDAEAWELKYKHGALASSEFTRKGGAGAVPAHLRGTVIHGVLERIEAEAELSRLLDETIGSLDDPDIENAFGGRVSLSGGSGAGDREDRRTPNTARQRAQYTHRRLGQRRHALPARLIGLPTPPYRLATKVDV